MPRQSPRILSLVAISVALVALAACSTSVPNRNPVGEPFPTVSGESLDGEAVTLPDALAGQPAVLLIGYKQETQFDIDRWLLGFAQTGLKAPILEVPTIPSLGASLASGFIDDGMRAGIPKEDWGIVVTLYGGAAKPVVALTGNENGNNARVMVLDAEGTVAWFHDRGYSTSKVLELVERVTEMQGGGQ